uniref:Uncharacterized protein n=1 Tax=Oryza barthii TaxID=65489 RepID=A0A0D3FYX5_9ORYZ
MAGYRRTISFPAPRPAAFAIGATARDKLAAAYHVRSASLPCRFHPLVVQLDDDVAALRLLRSESRVKPEEKARRAAFERHENLERCIASVDSSGEKVFRALVNTRVSLLNILSPSF